MKINANIIQIRYTPIENQNVITYQVIASFENPNQILFPGMTANIDIIVEERINILKIKNSALNLKLKGVPSKPKKNQWGGNSGGQSDMQNIMEKLKLTTAQRGKMRGIWPQLGKKKEELTNKGMSEEKISKQVNNFFENLFIELLTDEQKSKFINLKSSEIKNAYQLIDGLPVESKLSIGLKAGGYSEILNSKFSEGDKFISKIIITESSKKALRLF